MKKKFKYILGIQCFASQDSGACIIQVDLKKNDYEYVAISEERLVRKKYPYTFPIHSILYCMRHFNIKKFQNIDLIVSDIIREHVWERSGPSFNVKEFDYIKSILKFSKKKIIQINHHLAHAASVYYTSGFSDSAILIVDGNGTDLETNSFYRGRNKKIDLIDKYKARGIGALYSEITKSCLNLGAGGEGKTMGLAPFGKKGKRILDFSKVKFKGIETDYSSLMKRMPFSDILSFDKNKKIKSLILSLGKRKKNENILKQKWKKIAYDLQCETERCLVHLGKEIERKINSKNICIAGGVALNSVANQKLFKNTKFKNIFVYPACSDAGIPFGLAIWGLYNHKLFNKRPIKIKKMINAYTGSKYSSIYVESFLKKNKIYSEKVNLTKVANLISKGKVVAWFQNNSEYGPRALGNRSILADSRNPKMTNYVNYKVKHRESYRPFAPAVLEDDFKKFFDLKNPSPYMLLVSKVKKPKIIPSVTHVDGTARVQTVNKEQNEIFYKLLKEFKKITGIGCIMNTSFNDAGEPIVETPEDAVITFLGTKIDYLVVGNRMIKKNSINKNLRKKIMINRLKKINSDSAKALNIITKNYKKKNFFKYKKRIEKIALWNCLEKPIYVLEKQINKWIKNKQKVIIYGTFDQTKIIMNMFKNFNKINIIGFLPFKKNNDDLKNKKLITLPFKILNKKSELLKRENYEFLISSYEYLYDIERDIEKNYKSKNHFKFYNGYNRNLVEYLKFKKNKFI